MTAATLHLDQLRAAHDRKRFADVAAKFAMNGWSIWRSDPDDGVVRYFAARYGRVTEPMGDLTEAEQFLARVTGKKL